MWVTTEARVTRNQARRRLSIGRAMRELPAVDAAFLAGEISAEHVEVLAAASRQSARAAVGVAAAEPELVRWAKAEPFHRFNREVKEWLVDIDPDGSEKRAGKTREGRRVNLSSSLEGQWFLDGALEPVGGEIVHGVLRGIESELWQADRAAEAARLASPESFEFFMRTPAQRRADALTEMAMRAATAPADGRRPHVVLVGASAFARTCQTAAGTVLTPGALVPWLADAHIERVVFDGPDRVMAVGRRR